VTEAEAIPFVNNTGIINLGPVNKGALGRFANYAQKIADGEVPMPESPFIEWAAERVTGADRQDLVIFIQGRRGSGKSYSCLWIGKRLGEAIAKRKGGKWQDYFSLKNVATLEDTARILELLSSTGKYQVVLVDDCSLAISNRSWNTPENRNFNALLSICRTNRWILLLTAPLKKHTDNQTRDMCDLTGTVFKSFHAGGFNILKLTSSDISTIGKEYTRKMHFEKRKVDYWVTFKPDKELTTEYDKQRDESARQVNTRIVQTGSYKVVPKREPKKSIAERNMEELIQRRGEEIKKYVTENPKVSLTALSAHFCLSYNRTQGAVERLGLKLVERRGKIA